MSEAEAEPGPVGYVVVAFPAGKANFAGEIASQARAVQVTVQPGEPPVGRVNDQRPGIPGPGRSPAVQAAGKIVLLRGLRGGELR